MSVCTIAGFTTESLQYHQISVSIDHISKDYLILGTVPSCFSDSKCTYMVVVCVCVCVWRGSLIADASRGNDFLLDKVTYTLVYTSHSTSKSTSFSSGCHEQHKLHTDYYKRSTFNAIHVYMLPAQNLGNAFLKPLKYSEL